MVRVLFVCLGNICRSPSAEGVLRKVVAEAGLAHRIESRSAGTGAYHTGEGADPRSARAARRRGYDLSTHCARCVAPEDFDTFDYVLAMDRDNLRNLKNMQASRGKMRAKVALLLDYAPTAKVREVPDPYSTGDAGFEFVLDLIESACDGLLEEIRRESLGAKASV